LDGDRSRRSRPHRPRSDFSYLTSVSLVSTPWFFERWSVRAAKGLSVHDIGSDQTSPLPPAIVTELSCDSQTQVKDASAAPSTLQRVRPWKYNPVPPVLEPTLKRVLHATYGDLLQNEIYKGHDPAGFIAVPQSCSSQGDTLYHILCVDLVQPR
jgi:hypothetical protein